MANISLKNIFDAIRGVYNNTANLFQLDGGSSISATLQNAATATGNGTAVDVTKYATAILEVRGTFVATVSFEGSIDNTNWYPIHVVKRGDGTVYSSTTTTGLYEVNVSSLTHIRARISAFTSGSVTVVGRVSTLVAPPKSVRSAPNNVLKSAPVHGAKTVTTTAAEVFAGASRLANRYMLKMTNMGTTAIYWGSSSVTTANGDEILPGDSVVINIDPSIATAIYAIASIDTPIRVVELA